MSAIRRGGLGGDDAGRADSVTVNGPRRGGEGLG